MSTKLMQKTLLIELERIENEEFGVLTTQNFKPNKSASNPYASYYEYHGRNKLKWQNRKQYKTYAEFKEDYTNKKGRFGTGSFLRSKHNIFWLNVIDETEKCVKTNLRENKTGFLARCK